MCLMCILSAISFQVRSVAGLFLHECSGVLIVISQDNALKEYLIRHVQTCLNLQLLL